MPVQPFSSIAGSGSSEVDPHSNERSLESSSGKTLSFTVDTDTLGSFDSEHRTSVSVVPSVDQRDSLRPCMFDTSSRSGLCRGLYSSRCEPGFGSDFESDTNFMDPSANLPLRNIITQLTPQELAFFSMIDAQLDKVESFYLAREKEMVARSFVLLNQLKDLKSHRDVFVCRFIIPGFGY